MNSVKYEIKTRKELMLSRVQQKRIKIDPKQYSLIHIKKLLKAYPELKKSRFMADIFKSEITYATPEQVWNVIERCTLMLLQIQTETDKDWNASLFSEDRRVKALCKGLEELEIIVASLCLPSK